jgi:hypothetical protein
MMNVTAERTQWGHPISVAWQDPPGTRTPRRGPAMKTHPNTTAWLKLVVLDGDRDAIMVAATTGRSGDRVAIGRIAERAGGPRGNRSLTRLRTIDEAAELLNASRPAVGSNGARAPPQKENPARWSEVSSVLSKNQV